MEELDWTVPSHQGDFSSGVQIGSGPNPDDLSCLPCLELEKVPMVWEVQKGGETAFSCGGRW